MAKNINLPAGFELEDKPSTMVKLPAGFELEGYKPVVAEQETVNRFGGGMTNITGELLTGGQLGQMNKRLDTVNQTLEQPQMRAMVEGEGKYLNPKPIGLMENIQRGGVEGLFDKIMLGVPNTVELTDLVQTSYRVQDNKYSNDEIGRKAKEDDINKLVAYQDQLNEYKARGMTVPAQVGEVIGNVAPFIAEFLLTKGATATAKSGVRKAAQKMIGEQVEKGIGKAATKTAETITSAGVRTAMLPHEILKRFSQSNIPNTYRDIQGNIVFNQPESSPAKNFIKAIGDTYIEMLSEESGAALTAGKEKLGEIMARKSKVIAKLGQFWKKQKGGNIADFYKRIGTSTGFNGVLEEMGEERLGDFLRAVSNVDDFGTGKDATVLQRIAASLPDAQQLGVEALAFGIPGIARFGAGKIAGDTTQPTPKAQIPTTEQEIAQAIGTDIEKPQQPVIEQQAQPEPAINTLTPEEQARFDELRQKFAKTAQVAPQSTQTETPAEISEQVESPQIQETTPQTDKDFADLIDKELAEIEKPKKNKGLKNKVATPFQALQAAAVSQAPSPATLDTTAKSGGLKTIETGKPIEIEAFKGILTKDWRTGKEINEFKSANGPWAGFFTSDEKVADKFRDSFSTMGEAKTVAVKIKMNKPFVIDAKGGFAKDFMMDNVVFGENAKIDSVKIFDEGYDGIIIRNTKDEGDVFVPKSNSQIIRSSAIAKPKDTPYNIGMREDTAARNIAPQETADAGWEKKDSTTITNGQWDIEAVASSGKIKYRVKNNETLNYKSYQGDAYFPDIKTAKESIHSFNPPSAEDGGQTTPEVGNAPDEIFIRKATTKESKNPQKAMQDIPNKEGYKTVYKPYGEQGKGFYYIKNDKTTEAKSAEQKPKTPKERIIKASPNYITKNNKDIQGHEDYQRWDKLSGSMEVNLSPKEPYVLNKNEWGDLQSRHGDKKWLNRVFKPQEGNERTFDFASWVKSRFVRSEDIQDSALHGDRAFAGDYGEKIPGYEDLNDFDVFLEALEHTLQKSKGNKSKSINEWALRKALQANPEAKDLEWYSIKRNLIKDGLTQEKIDFAENEFYNNLEADYANRTRQTGNQEQADSLSQDNTGTQSQEEAQERQAIQSETTAEITDEQIDNFFNFGEEESDQTETVEEQGTPTIKTNDDMPDYLIKLEKEAKETLPIDISISDIDLEKARRAHYWTSFDPDRAARVEVNDYLVGMIDAFKKINKPATQEQKDIIKGEFEKFKAKYLGKFNELLSAKSQTASTAVAGPANFNTARNNKKNATVDRRYEELQQIKAKFIQYTNKRLKGAVVEEAGGELNLLKKKLENAEKAQNQMKIVNKIMKSKGFDDLTTEQKRDKLKESGFSDTVLDEILKPDVLNRTGFKGFELTNNLANIKRMRERVAILEKKESESGTETNKKFDGGELVINKDIDRIQFLFDDKPSQEIIQSLKKNGWRWSPSNKAWQRQATPNAMSSANNIIEKHFKVEQPTTTQTQEKPTALNKEDTARLEELKKKFSQRGKTYSGIDPELVKDAIEITGLYIKMGYKTLENITKQAVKDFGENIRPYLKDAFEAATRQTDLGKANTSAEVDNATAKLLDHTSARKADIKEDRKAIGLDTIPSPERKGFQVSLQEAKDQKIHENALRIAAEINTKPRALNDTETAGMVIKLTQLKNEYKRVKKELETITDEAGIKLKANELELIENEFDTITKAVRLSGTEKGRALVSQKLTLDEDYSLLSIKTKAKAAKGKALTENENQKIELLTKKLDETNAKLEQMQAEIDALTARTFVRQGSIARYRNMDRNQRRIELDDLIAKTKPLLEGGCYN